MSLNSYIATNNDELSVMSLTQQIPVGSRGGSVVPASIASKLEEKEPEKLIDIQKTIQNRIPVFAMHCHAINAIRANDYKGTFEALNKDVQRLNDQYPGGWYGGHNHLLHVAVYFNRLETVKTLLDMGATLECRTAFQYTPLMIACVNSYLEIACELITRGADRSLEECNKRSCDAMMSASFKEAITDYFLPKTPPTEQMESSSSPTVEYTREEKIADERMRIKIKFDEADVDGSGELDAEELAAFCETLGSKLSPEELEAALLILDESGDGQISYEEFAEWWLEDQ